MKRIAFFLVMTFCVLSCSHASLDGTWVSDDGTELTFNDGKFLHRFMDVFTISEGTYTVEGNTVTVIENTLSMSYQLGTYSINGNRLTITDEEGKVTTYTRKEENKADTGGYLTDTDVRTFSEDLIKDILDLSAIDQSIFMIFIDTFKNESSEHLDMGFILANMKLAFSNNGRFTIVDNIDEADFAVTGTVKTNVERTGNKTTRTYYITSDIVNMRTLMAVLMKQSTVIK